MDAQQHAPSIAKRIAKPMPDAKHVRNVRTQLTHDTKTQTQNRRVLNAPTPVDNRIPSPLKIVTIELPERVWGRLASLADNKGTTIKQLIATALADLVPPRTELELLVSEVRAATQAGYRSPQRGRKPERQS